MTNTIFNDEFGTPSLECVEYYNTIEKYAKQFNLKDTMKALELSANLHNKAFRDGGAPYIIHPLAITRYLILLNIRNAIFDMNLSRLHDSKLAEEQTNLDLDILLATSLLHDVVEDCRDKLPNLGQEFITEYGMHPDIFKYVSILTKNKKSINYSDDTYYKNICSYWQTSLVKLADRTNNCSTIDAFDEIRMKKYIKETKQYYYDMASEGKNLYPDFSRAFTIMKYLIVSICETVASALNLKDVISEEEYYKSFFFIKGFAIGKSSRQNTLKALSLAKEYYKNFTRKSGDPFIIHPLRVCSYLISLKIDDDIICAAALLHEIIKKCNLPYHGIEIVTKHHLDPLILDYIRLLANIEQYPIELFYEVLKQNPKVLLLKLSNRAHTCTTLIDSSDAEITAYIEECEKYIYPLCEYAIAHYPEYSNNIQILRYHISSNCNIVKKFRA